MGDTDFYPENIHIIYDEDAFISRSQLNSLRRDAISVLEEKLFCREKKVYDFNLSKFDINGKKSDFSLKINTEKIPDMKVLNLFSRIYLPYYYAEEKNMKKMLGSSADIFIVLSDAGKSYDYDNC